MSIRIQADQVTKTYTRTGDQSGRALRNAFFGITPREGSGPSINRAVDALDLKIYDGDRLGIIGPNGAGKSTLLHMIAGLTEPTSGTLLVNGKVTSIFTLGLGLREELSGRENIYIAGEVEGVSRTDTDKNLGAIIDFADIGEFIDMPVRTYSTGMKARLAFATIVHTQPEILLVDEALAVGDSHFAAKADKAMRAICDRGKVLILVSHDLSAIRSMCTRCLWMNDGKILMDGSPIEVTDAYLEAVRAEEEKKFAKRFQPLSKATNDGKATIPILDVRNRGRRGQRFQSEDDFSIVVTCEAAAELGAHLSVGVDRLDGLPIYQIPVGVVSANATFEIQLDPLQLGEGVYQITAQLRTDQTLVAERSTVVEVQSLNKPKGGRPVLLYPSFLTAQSAETNEKTHDSFVP